jgi:hypothetical protein
VPRIQPNPTPVPGQLALPYAADRKSSSATSESNSAESPSNSARRESNSAELQVTIPQSSKANSAEDDASSAASVSNSAVSQLIDARAVSLLSSSTTKATSMESITESEREGEGGAASPRYFWVAPCGQHRTLSSDEAELLGASVAPGPSLIELG